MWPSRAPGFRVGGGARRGTPLLQLQLLLLLLLLLLDGCWAGAPPPPPLPPAGYIPLWDPTRPDRNPGARCKNCPERTCWDFLLCIRVGEIGSSSLNL